MPHYFTETIKHVLYYFMLTHVVRVTAKLRISIMAKYSTEKLGLAFCVACHELTLFPKWVDQWPPEIYEGLALPFCIECS